MAFRVVSPNFDHEGAIPSELTCEGRDVSPELAWHELPAGTASLALIVDDPDAPDPRAPQRTWVHWVVWDIPPESGHLPHSGTSELPGGARIGMNDWKRARWNGPCPPIGRHRYFFKLYALDTQLGELAAPDKAGLERAMAGHILGEAQLIGTYQKHST